MRLQSHTIPSLLLIMLLTLSGCQTLSFYSDSVNKNATNFYLNEEGIGKIERVVMMPVHAPEAALTSEKTIDQQFLRKLSATQLFEVVSVSREELARKFGQRSFSSATPIKDSLFTYLKESTQADAVVFFDITSYNPFRPIRIGIRGKIINLPEKELLWAVDELYDSSNRKTSKRAVAYEKKHLSKMPETRQFNSILTSPDRFTAYAAERCVLSLPRNSLTHKF